MVLVAAMVAAPATALTPVKPTCELMAAAMAMALPALVLPEAMVLLLGSVAAMDAGMAKDPLSVCISKSPVSSDLPVPVEITPARIAVEVVGVPTGVPALPFRMGNPFHSCISETRMISCFSC